MDQSLNQEALAKVRESKPYTADLLRILPVLENRWDVPVLWALMQKSPRTFQELRSVIGPITNTTLTRTLRQMKLDGLVVHESANPASELQSDNMEFEESPFGPVHESLDGYFSPTELAIHFAGALNELIEWGKVYYRTQHHLSGSAKRKPD